MELRTPKQSPIISNEGYFSDNLHSFLMINLSEVILATLTLNPHTEESLMLLFRLLQKLPNEESNM